MPAPVRSRRRSGLLTAALLLALSIAAWPQAGYYFGQNKVTYETFDWAVFETEHFEVHYYPEIETAARDAARMAERGYAYLSEALDWEIRERVPLILYGSQNDFQQTNAVRSFLTQGTRGVTESLKNRVILPFTGSYREFNHVLVHELVHAFQFDMLFSDRLERARFNPPLWAVEGMAEYLSNGMDNITRMWVRDALAHDELPTLDKLDGIFDIRVYRIGQSVYEYIGSTYGKDAVGRLFRAAIRTGSMDAAYTEALGVDEKTLSEAWHAHARALSVPADSTLAPSGEAAKPIAHGDRHFDRLHVVPTVSPDGERVAYFGTRGFREGIFLLERDGDGELRETRLISGGSSGRFEEIRFFESGMAWSPDGSRLAFVSKSGKDDALYIMDVDRRDVIETIVIEEMGALQSPTFAPDGERIAFVGIRGGISDLYLWHLNSRTLERLSDDRFAELHPAWSPDGARLAFATDRGPDADPDRLLFSDYDIAVMDLDTRAITPVTEVHGNATNPQWSPDASELAFLSDHQGISNIYRVELSTGALANVTAFANGVSGITHLTPAFSWSRDGGTMVFSAFSRAGWRLYRLDGNGGVVALAAPAERVHDAADTEREAAAIARIDSLWLPAVGNSNALYADYELAPEDSVRAREYRNRFQLDGISLGAGYSSFYGLGGGALFQFSDMLGNHNLFVSTATQFNSLLHSDASVTYFNQARRWNWGIQAYNQSNRYLVGAGFRELGFLRNTYRGFNGLVSYPFSRFVRAELTAGQTWVDQDVVVERYRFSGIDRDSEDIGTFTYAQAGAALVFDNASYAYLGPNSGSRLRVAVERTVNDFRFTNLSADLRRYWPIGNRSVLAWRGVGLTSLGEDRRIYNVGSPYLYRGAEYDALYGSSFFVSNLEYRFPLFFFLPPQADFISGAAFVDAAGAWGIDVPGFASETFVPFNADDGFRLRDLNSAVGVAARINLGYFVLQYDVAWPTDLQRFEAPVARFSLGTFF